jgi:tetratricopeptide (TPR) repeat protein
MKTIVLLTFSVLLVNAQVRDTDYAKFTLAENLERAGQYEEALKLFEELYLSEISNTQYFNALHRVYLQLKNYAASIDLLEKRIIEKPDDISLHGMLGSTYYIMGNEEKAYEVWDKALLQTPNNPMMYRIIANYAVERRAFEKAIELYEHGKELSDDKVIFAYDLAQLFTLTMQFGKAADEYCTILDKEPMQRQVVEQRILSYSSKPDALEATIPVVEDWSDKSNLSLSYLLARLLTEAKKFEEAFEVYRDLDEEQSNLGKDLFTFAELLSREKNYLMAGRVYGEIIDLYPNSPLIPLAKLGYAKSIEATLLEDYRASLPLWKPYFHNIEYDTENVDDVLTAFKEVVEIYANTEAAFEALLQIGLINFYMQNDFLKASENFKIVITDGINSKSAGDAYIELGNIALLNNNLDEAELYFSKIIEKTNSNNHLHNLAKFKLARVHLYKQNFAEANNLLSAILYNLKDNNANDAIELSLILNTTINDSSNLAHFAEAEFLAQQEKFNEAASKYSLIYKNPQAFVLHSITKLRQAEMILANDDYEEAIKLFESIAEEGEKNIYADKALYLLGKTYHLGLGNKEKALEVYERLLLEFPDSLYINEARNEILSIRNKLS